ncbi:MAG TPA: endonuclease domain-containing protein [Actinomycetospora sp.]|uniref:endonuclease domain-containing protein n=1 Tax=Actinomycetospora sp. TaxID=1872135 RepID=UPI002F4245E3
MTTEPLPIKGLKIRICKDCEPRTKPLAAPYPGPRCYHHDKAWKRAEREKRHERVSVRDHGVPAGFIARLFAYQGRACAICHRAKGVSKRLHRDHNHKIPDPADALRGLICGKCNTYLGWIRDDPEVGSRMSRYLKDPPAQALLMAWNDNEPDLAIPSPRKDTG